MSQMSQMKADPASTWDYSVKLGLKSVKISEIGGFNAPVTNCGSPHYHKSAICDPWHDISSTHSAWYSISYRKNHTAPML
jgi:hypothetical protein